MFQWVRLLRVEYQWLMCCVNRNHELWCNLNYRLQPSSVVSKSEWNVPGASAVRDLPWRIYFPNQVLTGHFICKYTLSRRYEAGVRSGELHRHTSPGSWPCCDLLRRFIKLLPPPGLRTIVSWFSNLIVRQHPGLVPANSRHSCAACSICSGLHFSRSRVFRDTWAGLTWQISGPGTPGWAGDLHKSINCSEGYIACHSNRVTQGQVFLATKKENWYSIFIIFMHIPHSMSFIFIFFNMNVDKIE